ncbi:hypothetical protein EYF80_049059 [Liparis tanakae]|uniref:Uncharacterized protein n=1 Tax=Liparis tanakae TaxID=230148 RepID=A0A4Z2FII6_9TELE|nr:hypothetical protein EYF80_049059 [Liparis tanakae]
MEEQTERFEASVVNLTDAVLLQTSRRGEIPSRIKLMQANQIITIDAAAPAGTRLIRLKQRRENNEEHRRSTLSEYAEEGDRFKGSVRQRCVRGAASVRSPLGHRSESSTSKKTSFPEISQELKHTLHSRLCEGNPLKTLL